MHAGVGAVREPPLRVSRTTARPRNRVRSWGWTLGQKVRKRKTSAKHQNRRNKARKSLKTKHRWQRGYAHEAWCGRPARCGTGILPVPRWGGTPQRQRPGRPQHSSRAECPLHSGRNARTTTRALNVHSTAGGDEGTGGGVWGRIPGVSPPATQWAPLRGARVKIRFRYLSTSHLKSGGTTVVELYSTMMAGPAMRAPAASRSRS